MDAGSKAAINYINFSALAYAQFDDDARSHDIGYILKNKLYTETKDFKADKSEISALKEESNPLRSWILLDFISTPSGFRAAAFQKPKTGEIVFSFKGTKSKISNLVTCM
jgi:hypothetical protein